MRAVLTPVGELGARDIDAWRELAGAAIEPNPFDEPEYLLPDVRHLADGAHVGMLRIVAGGEWQACVPVRTTRSWHRLPIGAVAAWGPIAHHYVPTPLVRRDAVAAAAGALVDALRAVPRASLTSFDELPAGPVADALAHASVVRGGAPLQLDHAVRAIARRRAEPTYLDERVKGKHRAELRRLRRRLADAVGDDVRVRDRGGEAAAADRFMTLEAAGWKGRRGEPVASDERLERFFGEMTDGFRAAGRLQALCLEGAGTTLAMSINLRAQDGIFVLRIAYDERYARFSPGRQLIADMPGFFHNETSASWIDSCANPDNRLFNGLWPDRRDIATFILPAAGPRGRAATGIVRAGWPVRARVLEALHERARRRAAGAEAPAERTS